MAAGATYEPIATQTLGSATSTITFSSIPNSWTDLRLVFVATASTGTNALVRFNSDSGNNYSRTYLYGTGSTAASGRQTNVDSINITQYTNISQNAGVPSLRTLDIFSYAGSTFKTGLHTEIADQNSAGFDSVLYCVDLWRSTSAITSLSILTGGAATFSIGTTATLYGIKNA